MDIISKRFRKLAGLYRIFSADWECDCSENALRVAYELETFGRGDRQTIFNTQKNGYIIGKKWLDVSIAMHREDIKKAGHFSRTFATEFFIDPKYYEYRSFFKRALGLNHEQCLSRIK